MFKEAKQFLVGGVNSPVRSFSYVGGEPVLLKQGHGSKIYDYEGREFIDYCSSFGAMILGQARPEVVEAVRNQLTKGFGFGATHQSEVELARTINAAIPAIEKIRFVNSGTESLMSAVRLARGYTQRDKIVKFKNSYHGHADYLLAEAGSGLATGQIPLSKGVPLEFIKHTLIVDYGDTEALNSIFKQYGKSIAAVLVEPVGGNYGVTLPDIEFLKALRLITEKHDSLLVADEVITGFRFNFGSFLQTVGINADLICLGKIIGGGLPIGAYGGSSKIMNCLAPQGEVYQASTFSGNPIVMQAGIATLRILNQEAKNYEIINQFAKQFCDSISKYAVANGIDLKISRYRSMFSFKFSDRALFSLFYRSALEQGVYFAPSEYEANFLSFAHSSADIAKSIISVKKTLSCFVKKEVS